MLIARWYIQARFGHKDKVMELMRQWDAESAPQVGLDPSQLRYVTGSVGALESVIESEFRIENLTALDEMFTKMAKIEAMGQWANALEPHVVSGTNRWEVFHEL